MQQGDPLGPALFAYGLSEVLTHAKGGVDRSASIATLAYLDDVVNLGGLHETVAMADAVAASAIETRSGLSLNWGKCHVITADVRAAESLFAERNVNSRPQIARNGEVLGAPVGETSFTRNFWDKYVQDQAGPRVRSIFKIDAPNTGQEKLALLRFCAVPLVGHMLRSSHPATTAEAAGVHDVEILTAFCKITCIDHEAMTVRAVRRARRPTKLGGFGLYSAFDTATAAFIASVSATHDRVLEIPVLATLRSNPDAPPATPPPEGMVARPEATRHFNSASHLYQDLIQPLSSFDGAIIPGVNKAAEKMKEAITLPARLEDFEGDSKVQRAICEARTTAGWLEEYNQSSDEERALMLSTTQSGALDAFLVIPFENELRLVDAAFNFGVRKSLGLSTPEDVEAQVCTCDASRREGQHIRNCGMGSGRTLRHDSVVKALAAMLSKAKLRPAIEPRAEYYGTGNGGPDIAVDNFPKQGLDAFVEFSVVNPTQSTLVARAARIPLSAASQREKAKRDKYAAAGPLNNRAVFAAAAESTGAFGIGLLHLIKKAVATDEASMAPEQAPWLSQSPTAYWTQRISVAFHRASYVMAERVVATAQRNARRAL